MNEPKSLVRIIINKNIWSSSIIPSTIVSQTYFTYRNEDNLALITLLKDKSYQLYNKYLKLEKSKLDYAREASKAYNKNTTKFPGWDIPLDAMSEIITKAFTNFRRSFSEYMKELSGFDSINEEDYNFVQNKVHSLIFIIKHSDLYIEDQLYHVESGIQITTEWIIRLLSKEKAEMVFKFHRDFNNLKLFPNEIAVLIPTILSFPFSNYIFLINN